MTRIVRAVSLAVVGSGWPTSTAIEQQLQLNGRVGFNETQVIGLHDSAKATLRFKSYQMLNVGAAWAIFGKNSPGLQHVDANIHVILWAFGMFNNVSVGH